MTDTEINMAIAEWHGWKWYRLPSIPSDGRKYRCLFYPQFFEDDGKIPNGYSVADGTERICNWEYMKREGMVWNYVGDLNAMHAAEQHGGDKVIKAMRFFLCDMYDQMTAHHADAPHRARAILMAIDTLKAPATNQIPPQNKTK